MIFSHLIQGLIFYHAIVYGILKHYLYLYIHCLNDVIYSCKFNLIDVFKEDNNILGKNLEDVFGVGD
jgi:hypothetical protein